MKRAVLWLRRWGVSFASLTGGLLTLFVFRRELPHASWIIGYLLLLWLLMAITVQIRDALESSERRAHRLAITAADYTIQTLYHGVLLFLLPAYWASTTLTSLNAFFFAVLVGLALLATFDPWYGAIVHPRPWFAHVFFGVSVFAALNVALPLVGLPPHAALPLAAAATVLALTPVVRRAARWPWGRTLAVMAVAAVAGAAAVSAGRVAVPPAPLFIAHSALAWPVGAVESLEPRPWGIPVTELRERGLVARTAIYAPAGLRQSVQHVWRREGRVIDVVTLAPIHGGRREGFRTFSRKTGFPGDAVGRWTVDVTTGAGQLIGRLRFRVIP